MSDSSSAAALATEIHVWIADTKTVSTHRLTTLYLSLLDQDERARYHRFHFDADRHDYLAAHALLRTALSRYAPCPPDLWRFVSGTYGKPEIAWPTNQSQTFPPLRFNLTHTKGMVACVIALERDCGIDVERLRPMRDMRAMGEMVFSPSELAQFDALPDSARPTHFFKLWTMKEAYIKAIGLGFSAPLRSITFDVKNTQVTLRSENEAIEDAGLWLLQHHHPDPEYQIAVAVRQKNVGKSIVYRMLNLDDGLLSESLARRGDAV